MDNQQIALGNTLDNAERETYATEDRIADRAREISTSGWVFFEAENGGSAANPLGREGEAHFLKNALPATHILLSEDEIEGLTIGEIASFIREDHELIGAMIAANTELLRRMARIGGVLIEQVHLLDEWWKVHAALQEAAMARRQSISTTMN